MLGDVAISPVDAAHRLRSAVDGRLEALADAHRLSLVVLFGGESRGQPDARDLDIAVGARARTGLDVVAVICALMDLAGTDRVDLRLDPSIVQSRLSVMRGLLDDLADVVAAGKLPLAENRMLRHGVERILTQLVEVASPSSSPRNAA